MVTTPGSTSPPAQYPPPPVPQDPTISNTLTNYLQQFSLWCRRGFGSTINTNTALTGITMQAYDAPTGVIPTVWTLRVSQAGLFTVDRVPLGGGKP